MSGLTFARRCMPLVLLLVACPMSVAGGAEVRPLTAAHAHNDYRHPHPLFDALDNGFCSVEADVFEVDGELQVGHDRSELRRGRTLRSLYLDPLRERSLQNHGRVYPEGPVFTLLVDFKSPAQATYATLKRILADYESMLVRVVNGQRHESAVQVILSGNRPTSDVAAEYRQGYCLVAIDGRLSDLSETQSRPWMPLISDRWTSHFQWDGTEEFSDVERQELERLVRLTHAQGKRLRFWETPDRQSMWQHLQQADIDLINTDDLAGLAGFLRAGQLSVGSTR